MSNASIERVCKFLMLTGFTVITNLTTFINLKIAKFCHFKSCAKTSLMHILSIF